MLDVTQAFTGKRVLFAGATGFLGKVSLSLLLHRYGPVLERVYVVVRRGSHRDAATRFFHKVAQSEPFQPLKDAHGDGLEAFLRGKCTVLDGDITDPWLGLPEAEGRALQGQVDVMVNCAGLVSFNPSLEVGLSVNTHGVRHLTQACLHWGVPLVHVSTAFVAGNRNGLVFEDEEVVGSFPKKDELEGVTFSLDEELADCERTVARLRQSADDRTLASTFRQKALERLRAEGRDVDDERTLRLAVGRERKLWLTTQLVEAGTARARHWGWPNTYTYTKALGEQLIASTPGLHYSLVRPSIVESALHYPFPGWNEGFTTSAPLIYATLRGHRSVPASENAVLDLIPVDHVAGSLLAITAKQLVAPERRVYHQATGDSNPLKAPRSVELSGLYRRRFYQGKEKGSRLVNDVLARVEPQAVSEQAFSWLSAPLVARGARALREAIASSTPRWGAPRVSALLERAQEQLETLEESSSSINNIVELFLPFTYQNRYVFRCDNTRALYAELAPHDRARIPFAPESIVWREYFLDVHIPGLERHVFPALDEESERRRVIPAYRDLLELFDASVHRWNTRAAFRLYEGDASVRYSYGEVHRYAARVGSFLLSLPVKAGDRVMLLSENRPEWGMCFFGILRAGATAVPVDTELGEAEVANIARRSGAVACLISEKMAEELPGLHKALAEAGVATELHSLAQAMAGNDAFPDGIGPVRKSASPEDVASILFTSGTTGTPKGVMLSHRNFTSLVAKLAGAFDIGVGDGVLSVLPLHHTLEFSAGFLTPFSRGAEVAYIDEVNADRIGEVLETGNVNGMVGVPALWQLFHRRITQEITSQPRVVEEAIKALMSANAELRKRRGINFGKLLFWPVHRRLGGMKFLVSGGSALPDEVQKDFHAFGFDLDEGYGLTEAAPVLTVNQAGDKRLPGSVGKVLPGIELRIDEPDNDGVGEVLAKGPNVMAGYFQDRDATQAVLKDGWLRTGDLGRLDAEGHLYLVGRKKDVIIDANGKNVYPDELEELYAANPHVKELSIVGLPDAEGGEKVAALVVPDDQGLPRAEVKARLEAHFQQVSDGLPFFRRVKVWELKDLELPRTSTRKVKRPLVVKELEKLLKAREKAQAQADGQRHAGQRGDEGQEWILQAVAEVLNRSPDDVAWTARLATDLGFDSLMFNELSSALEAKGAPGHLVKDLTRIQTVSDLRVLLSSTRGKVERRVESERRGEELEVEFPAVVATAGREVLSRAQRALYGGLFDVKVTGRVFVPKNRNVLVVANHASHLDMGLVRVALGEHGEKLVALAAKDYFFDTQLKRMYFENFTNLIPMDRSGSLRESLRLAGESLTQGFNLLIFPEGTRTPDGEIHEFKPTTGYLALTYGVDILPVYLHGTYDAFPKGSWWPRFEKLEVRIGPTLQVEELKARVQGLSRSEGHRAVTRLAEEAVRALARGETRLPGRQEPAALQGGRA